MNDRQLKSERREARAVARLALLLLDHDSEYPEEAEDGFFDRMFSDDHDSSFFEFG